jgi:hypothetical protein
MTTLHPTTFEYLQPTDAQKSSMMVLRSASQEYAELVDSMLPDGPDKTYVLRRIRETAMWINVAVTREADGAPRA